MSVFMLSLIGLPLTGGFIGKLQIFQAALEEGWVWLTIIGLLNSALSVYYYLRVVVYLYMREGRWEQAYNEFFEAFQNYQEIGNLPKWVANA